MPPFERHDLKQNAVYWEMIADDGYGGIAVSSTPKPIEIRYSFRKRETQDKQNKAVNSDIDIITKEELIPDSIVWLGKIEEMPDTTAELTNLYQVISISKTFDLKGRNVRYVGFLSRYGNTFPETVGTGT